MSGFDDELASAWLDGELTADELARAGADPKVVEARAQFDAVRRVVGRPVPVPDRLREDHLARALEEWSDPAGAGTAGAVVPLRPGRRRSTSPWLSRAAVLLVAVGAIGLAVTQLGDGDATDESETAAVTTAGSGDRSSTAGEVGAAAESAGGVDNTEDPAAGAGAAAESAEGPDTADEAPGGDEGRALEAAEGSDHQEQPAMGSAASDPALVAATAAELTADALPAADELVRQLEERFGPPAMWGSQDHRPCAQALDEQYPSQAPHLEVFVARPAGDVVLVVPQAGRAGYVAPDTCQPLE